MANAAQQVTAAFDESLCLQIGRFVIDEQGSTAKAIRSYPIHGAEIVLAAILSAIDQRANHRTLRARVLALAASIDEVALQ